MSEYHSIDIVRCTYCGFCSYQLTRHFTADDQKSIADFCNRFGVSYSDVIKFIGVERKNVK